MAWRGAWGGFVVAVLTVARSSTAWAGHCEYCNEPLPTAVWLGAEEIGTDGVLVVGLADPRERWLDPAWWAVTVITVEDAEGMPLAGTLALHEGFAPAVWRPLSPWSPGRYHVRVEVDRAAFEAIEGLDHCHPVVHEAELVVVDELRHVTGSPTLTTEEAYSMVPSQALEALVCCDAALPSLVPVPGLLRPGYPDRALQLGEGYCAERQGEGQLSVTTQALLDGAPAPYDYALREVTLDRRMSGAGTLMTLVLTAPRCLEFELLDLVTDQRTLLSSCHGEAIASELGELELDPSAALAANCSDQAYVCEDRGGGWDPAACTTWPDGAPFVHPSTLPDGDDPPPASEGSSDGCRVATGLPPRAPWLLGLVFVGRVLTRAGRRRG